MYPMKKNKQQSKEDKIKQEEDYVAFLLKRLSSENFRANSTIDEIEKTKAKYDKAKLKLKFLKDE
jgi:hypothetical protein